MEVFLIIICAILFADTILLAMFFAVIALGKRYKSNTSECNNFTSEMEKNYGMSDAEIKEFTETDAESVQNFMDALSDLNNFMTGKEEEHDVEQQEF